MDDLDTVVGYTDTLLLRHHVLEDTLNNFIADGILSVSDNVADVRVFRAGKMVSTFPWQTVSASVMQY